MKDFKFDINKLRVASPCSIGWEQMTGDERVRHCNSCQLNIYNIAEMTKLEVENLISAHEDRLCIRLHRRADGKISTKDCPVGFRAYQKRIARFAGATLAVVLGLFSSSFGQKKDKKSVPNSQVVETTRAFNQKEPSSIYGTVRDVLGASIPNAEIIIFKEKKKKIKIKSNDEGIYKSVSLTAGEYNFEVKADGFKNLRLVQIKLKDNEHIELDFILEGKNENVTVGIYTTEPSINVTSSSVAKTISREMIDKLPH